MTDVDTTHWTGKPQRLTSLLRWIDGKTFRLMGAEPAPDSGTAADRMSSCRREPFLYTFAGSGVQLALTFMTAFSLSTHDLPDDLDVLSRPVTYLTWEARSTDTQKHTVSVYLTPSGDCRQSTKPTGRLPKRGCFQHQSLASVPLNSRSCKNRRRCPIDWGYFYVAMAKNKRASSTVNSAQATRAGFITNGRLIEPAVEASLQTHQTTIR